MKKNKIEVEVKENIIEESSNSELKEESLTEEKQENPTPASVENEEIQKLKNENAELNDRLMRKIAEFENYKKRTEIETANLLRYSGEFLIKKLLPVIDDFERSLKFVNDPGKDPDSVLSGLALVYEKLMKTLSEQGISKIEALNKPFDVDYHEAVLQQPTSEVEPLTVINEIETGYLYKDRVIRHTKVIVSSPVPVNE
ncbi:MAG: nucleotide exchange factor GrpE [Ignavibacteriales bacterium]|jgi:molecular chaperone GrpE|nr:nucleotide exchange factor GrpE [Ignavibacteriaceae bacterium]NLH60241.1 nucleotide exchange factor GrpE [Ignavibacteriales bacterium]HOJ17359.1 nucleotide exchange factor GrpE [Ignavibacteriaceae bacterium]HPO54823.1 nucleotide exchange factor GrpE [Ignavibacteriaceae bacterium]